ncbi:hypothetical protein NDI47_04025 [Microcoleus vaginatus GB1-A2]|uniref:hypothetical protein n=1 Tax=Microcoleus vaginatus TaxID=119532 RepID=UPI001682F4DD|nr:hypothetical protein [Microcoleus sp. FACHB-61]
MNSLLKAELRFVVRNASPLAEPPNTAAATPVFDTGRASPDIASIASKTDIRLEKASIARIRDLRLKNCAIAVPSTDSE